MTRKEFINKLQECYFGNKTAFNEIIEYFDTLQNSLQTQCQSLQGQVNYLRRSIERKEEQIADWQTEAVLAQSKIDDAIDFSKSEIEYCKELTGFECCIEEINKLLQILERTDK